MHIFRVRAGLKFSAAMLLYVSFTAALAAPASAQLDQWGYWENGLTEPWWLSSENFTKEDAVAAVARWKSIGVEGQSAEGAGWDGDYSNGSGTHGTYMRWSPRAGFIIVHVDKCQARVMGLTYGRVEASPTLVQFFPEFDKAASNGHGHSHSGAPQLAAQRFVPVTWGSQRMLVAEGAMSDFGDYVAGLGRYNYNRSFFYFEYVEFLTRHGTGEGVRQVETGTTPAEEETDRAASIPVVPPAYERFLKKPIEAVVTAVGKRQLRNNYSYQNPDKSGAVYTRASLTFVTVNAGTAHGLKTGMFLSVAEPAGQDEVRITRAGKHSSTGVVVRGLDDAYAETCFGGEGGEPGPCPKVAAGWKLTTSLL